LPGFPSFAELLRRVGRLGVPRVRFITSHPINFSDDIIEAIADTPAVCRYIHLPVQAGSNRVLRRMAREYTREYYLERIARIREALPDASLSTDVIVGFPGETDEDFQETLSLYEAVGYDMAFMFIYSERAGTPAATHFDDIPHAVKVERLMRLIEKQKEWSLRRYQAWVGREAEVLIKGGAHDGDLMQGHTRGNHTVVVPRAFAPKPGLYLRRSAARRRSIEIQSPCHFCKTHSPQSSGTSRRVRATAVNLISGETFRTVKLDKDQPKQEKQTARQEH
jgi:tRNA-2-methylthio-N6-dimethylallyladenosine synthase